MASNRWRTSMGRRLLVLALVTLLAVALDDRPLLGRGVGPGSHDSRPESGPTGILSARVRSSDGAPVRHGNVRFKLSKSYHYRYADGAQGWQGGELDS